MHLHPAHIATLLAGLRLLQATPLLPAAVMDIATNNGELRLITDLEIDSLATMLNSSADHLVALTTAEAEFLADGARLMSETGLDEADIGAELAERLDDTEGEPEYVAY